MKKNESFSEGQASQELKRYEVEGIDKNGAATKLITLAYDPEEAIQRMKDLAPDKNFIDIVCKLY